MFCSNIVASLRRAILVDPLVEFSSPRKFEFFPGKIATERFPKITHRTAAAHSCSPFVFKYLINIWKKKTQVRSNQLVCENLTRWKYMLYNRFSQRGPLLSQLKISVARYLLQRQLIFSVFVFYSPRPRTFSQRNQQQSYVWCDWHFIFVPLKCRGF